MAHLVFLLCFCIAKKTASGGLFCLSDDAVVAAGGGGLTLELLGRQGVLQRHDDAVGHQKAPGRQTPALLRGLAQPTEKGWASPALSYCRNSASKGAKRWR